jgi:hypothetical protein
LNQMRGAVPDWMTASWYRPTGLSSEPSGQYLRSGA